MRSLLGTYYLEIDQPDNALTHFREAVTAHRKLKAERPNVMEVREDLTEAITMTGAALETVAGKEPPERREQHLREAQGFFKDACAAYRDLFAITSPMNTEKRTDFHKLAQERAWDAGRIAIMRKDWDDAVPILESAVQFDAKLRNPLRDDTYDGIVRNLQYANSQQKKPGDSIPSIVGEHSKKQKPLKAKRN
ncbi:MAG TPA: hypothetical protein VGZ00_13385 [Candidatus Baltobacteraceae bacterium]|nr:hypothetical protein [Candidatus Baltobacteraceae bacterium]